MSLNIRFLKSSGYRYLKHKSTTKKIWWRCENYKKGCKGWASQEGGNIIITRKHNHPPILEGFNPYIDFYNSIKVNLNEPEREMLLTNFSEHKKLLEIILLIDDLPAKIRHSVSIQWKLINSIMSS